MYQFYGTESATPAYVCSQLHSWNWGSPVSVCLLANTAVASHSSASPNILMTPQEPRSHTVHYEDQAMGVLVVAPWWLGLSWPPTPHMVKLMSLYSEVTTLKPVAGMVILVSPGFGWVEVLSYHPGPS